MSDQRSLLVSDPGPTSGTPQGRQGRPGVLAVPYVDLPVADRRGRGGGPSPGGARSSNADSAMNAWAFGLRSGRARRSGRRGWAVLLSRWPPRWHSTARSTSSLAGHRASGPCPRLGSVSPPLPSNHPRSGCPPHRRPTCRGACDAVHRAEKAARRGYGAKEPRYPAMRTWHTSNRGDHAVPTTITSLDEREGANAYSHLAPLFKELVDLPPDSPRHAEIRAELIAGYLPVARHIARRFGGRGEPEEDLVQAGTIGLIGAVDRFDPGRGVGLPLLRGADDHRRDPQALPRPHVGHAGAPAAQGHPVQR